MFQRVNFCRVKILWCKTASIWQPLHEHRRKLRGFWHVVCPNKGYWYFVITHAFCLYFVFRVANKLQCFSDLARDVANEMNIHTWLIYI